MWLTYYLSDRRLSPNQTGCLCLCCVRVELAAWCRAASMRVVQFKRGRVMKFCLVGLAVLALLVVLVTTSRRVRSISVTAAPDAVNAAALHQTPTKPIFLGKQATGNFEPKGLSDILLLVGWLPTS